MKNIIILVSIPIVYGLGLVCSFASEDIRVVAKRPHANLSYKIIADGKLLVSLTDSQGEPIRGLKAEDFKIGSGIRKAKIFSAEPLESIKDIPLNIVLVIDNSFSMKERRAIEPLLSALDEFFKTVRSIDNIHLVVFHDHPKTSVNRIALHTQTFRSNEVSELKDFLNQSFKQGLTGKTYLYEGIMAGIDIIRKMPEKDHKFLVIFSDGEDLNSDVSTSMIETEVQGIKNLEAFCVDYMPGVKTDRFLTSFAETHGGRIWKATSASELHPIFKAFTTTLLYRYLITYQILDAVIIDPDKIDFDILTLVDGSPIKNYVFFETAKSEIPSEYILFANKSEAASFDSASRMTAWERYLNILNFVGQDLARNATARIKIIGCNANTGVEKADLDLSRQRAEAVKSYLSEVWGIDNTRMTIEARNLPEQATPRNLVGARTENQRVQIEYDSVEMQAEAENRFMVETSGTNKIDVSTNIFSEFGFSDWQLIISGDERPLKTLDGSNEIEPRFMFPLEELGLEELVATNTIGVKVRGTDIQNKAYETATVLVPVTVSTKSWADEMIGQPYGSVRLEPETIVIEELTTIDSSPFLNYIYFDEGSSDIPGRYTLFNSQEDTKSFDERRLKDTMEKHNHMLNIIGQRLLKHSEARIRIVGCNSKRGIERGKIDLSRSRAEAVKAYLRYIWGIEPSRMEVEARNLPELASTSALAEGRAENQRVEIHSDATALLDVIRSTYVQEISNTKHFRVSPQIQSGYEINRWSIVLSGDGKPIGTLQGEGDLEPDYYLMINDIGLQSISACKTITAYIEVTDRKGDALKVSADSMVQFIKREERLAQKTGYKVLEKYALILFDFNRFDIKERNREIVDRIVARIQEIPTATVRIVGHTDIIGNEEYNLTLSIKRAEAAYNQILASGVDANENISFEGVGPHNPLFDNNLAEGRALNRTVTVTLEYEQSD
jgi:outer membrane protein OmpA-like peptidoglycan-associated protein